jgi:LPS O-antigen subunit length determinant protein (WzzB/FepE family)
MGFNMEDPLAQSRLPEFNHQTDLVLIMQLLWLRRRLIAAITGLSCLMMIAYLHVADFKYTASLMVLPPQSMAANSKSNLSSLGGLASLAGVRLPQDSSSLQFLKYVETLHSYETAQTLLTQDGIANRIFEQDWNQATNSWQEPRSMGRPVINLVKRLIGVPIFAWRAPDAGRLQEFLSRHVVIYEDPKKPIVTVTFQHRDPIFAEEFLAKLHQAVETRLRASSQARTQQNIAYLAAKLKTVAISEHRTALSEALGEQERALMLAESNAPFAAEVIGGINISDRPTNPRPLLFLIGSCIMGLTLGALYVFLRANIRS